MLPTIFSLPSTLQDLNKLMITTDSIAMPAIMNNAPRKTAGLPVINFPLSPSSGPHRFRIIITIPLIKSIIPKNAHITIILSGEVHRESLTH